MTDNQNDPTGIRSLDASRSRSTRMLIIAIVVVTVTIAVILLAGPELSRRMNGNAVSGTRNSSGRVDPATTTTNTTTSQVDASPAETSDAETDRTDAAEPQEEAEPEFAEADVRQAMCDEYAKRYLKARTGVDLVRAVQLSQAAGCGWNAMLHSDAATHDFVPGALKVAQEMQAEDVPTEESSSAGSVERIDRLSEKIDDLDRKVDELRYRVR